MRRPLFLSALLAAAAPLLAAPPPPVSPGWDRTKPHASAAWVRLNPVPGRPSAGYLTLTGGGQPDRLTGATAPGVRIELHSMSMAGGVMKMEKLDALPLPAGATAAFAPGGKHLMIFGLTAGAKSLPITLVFASGAKVTVPAEVRAAGGDQASHH
ncbi:hypothetical protein IP88_15710 [alpha proteobacterium AAP81b]|nr:hypothetical protein IP88_15710 [alpha proteobacterium AAP81b]